MDIAAYKLLQQSGWIREQAERITRGEPVACPVLTCDGHLDLFRAEMPEGGARGYVAPAGVRCSTCKAQSRPVAI
jgi:hypothetical protein